MNPPNLYWSAELASEAGGEPLNGLIEGNTYGLFCWDLRDWARLASLPGDAVEVVPDGETARLRERIERVRQLHRPTLCLPLAEGKRRCSSCDTLPGEYPCPTIRALDGEEEYGL